jgi:glycosyltransferase involved in cell wall biosynthesis
MKQIICISTSNYYPLPTRKQNVMNRLKDADIIYMDPPVTLLAPLKDKSAFQRLFAYRKPGIRAKENIIVFATPPVLPFYNKCRLINRLNQRILAGYIKRRMKEEGFQNPYLWCYSPTSCDLTKSIKNRGVIYDCVDRHSAYKGMINPEVVDRMEADLASGASYVFCTAKGLYDTLKQYNENISLIPNGADYELFSRAFGGDEENIDLNKPVFGFIGMLQECIEYDYMEALVRQFPHGELIIVGRPLPGVDLSPLEKYPNVHFKGLLPQEELPGIIRSFNVCLNLFKEGNLSKDVSPLKLYEYLATGKPIVSTGEPLQVLDYAGVIYIAENKEDFVLKCKEALEEKDPEKRRKRMEYGKACSWDNRVGQMEKILIEHGGWNEVN